MKKYGKVERKLYVTRRLVWLTSGYHVLSANNYQIFFLFLCNSRVGLVHPGLIRFNSQVK